MYPCITLLEQITLSVNVHWERSYLFVTVYIITIYQETKLLQKQLS